MAEKNGNWTILDTEKKFQNGFFAVFEDQVIKPDGERGTYATIRFKHGASILPVDDQGNVYLTWQFRYALRKHDLEAASGALDDGEDPLEAAKREAKEELGIEAEDWTGLGYVEADTSITNSRAHLFLARKLRFHEPDQEATEDIEMVRMPLTEAFEKVMRGEITHDQTVILILKAYLLQDRE